MNMLDGNLPERSSCRDRTCRAPASCSDPRRVSRHRDVERYDPQPSQVLLVPLSGIPHKEDEALGTSYFLCASGCYNLVLLLTGSLPDAGLCVPRSTSVLRERGSDSPDACREPSVCMAYLSPLISSCKPPLRDPILSLKADKKGGRQAWLQAHLIAISQSKIQIAPESSIAF